MIRIYKRGGTADRQTCFCIEVDRPLLLHEEDKLKWLLAPTYAPEDLSEISFISAHKRTVIVGPRLAVATADSSNAVSGCRDIGLTMVTRVEEFRETVIDETVTVKDLLKLYDHMTEEIYEAFPLRLESDALPQPVMCVPVLKYGVRALDVINRRARLGLVQEDLPYYAQVFLEEGRNPTTTELSNLANMMSDHSRHWLFRGIFIIDGVRKALSLMELVKRPLLSLPAGACNSSVIAFHDNASAINGLQYVTMLVPSRPGYPSPLVPTQVLLHPTDKAETHNHPTGIEPFQGAMTGVGGRLRDMMAVGRGGIPIAGLAGFVVGNLNIPGYKIPGERPDWKYPANYASPLHIGLEAPGGAWDYGNPFGEPTILGFMRSIGVEVGGVRWEAVKPTMISGGVGFIDDRHLVKEEPVKGMKIVMIGGPAYRIGLGGAGASSKEHGTNAVELDFQSVQRGDPQMEQRIRMVIETCVLMGHLNPIESAHDQGAGGPGNVLSELVYPAGGVINIRMIKVGDKTLSVLEIWNAEYQERMGLLIREENMDAFRAICEREGVPLEELGEITGDGYIRVNDPVEGTMPVNLPLGKILEEMPMKTFEDTRQPVDLQPFEIPSEYSVQQLVEEVFKRIDVGSKAHLVREHDRSVTGLIVQQQCCGPMQVPISDYGLVALSHHDKLGAVRTIGEKISIMLVNPAAGARMAGAELLLNMVGVVTGGIDLIRVSANWQWPAKQPGEKATLYDTAEAISQFQQDIRGAYIHGGKDSPSMAAKVDGVMVKSPRQLVLSGIAIVPDFTIRVTSDLKAEDNTALGLLDISHGYKRLGGSALALAFGQVGDETPDVDDRELLVNSRNAVQELVREGLLLALHDRSDGGVIATVAEMAMAGGNTGCTIRFSKGDIARSLLHEELGLVMQYRKGDLEKIKTILEKYGVVSFFDHGFGSVEVMDKPMLMVLEDDHIHILETIPTVRGWFERTSNALRRLRISSECADAEEQSQKDGRVPRYHLSFDYTPLQFVVGGNRPKVAVIRAEGSNGDKEMGVAFDMAGFEVWPIHMRDITSGKVTLTDFHGAAFVGGFANADVFESGKIWAALARFNPRAEETFNELRFRKNTFSLGVCNGCQLMAIMGWTQDDIEDETERIRFVRNNSRRFESNWSRLLIDDSPSIMLQGMQGSVLGVHVAHGEGRLYAKSQATIASLRERKLVAVSYVDPAGEATETYPWNPNGSLHGIGGVCSEDGRHLAMMPHPERTFLMQQWNWVPRGPEWNRHRTSPWFRMFQNARAWCDQV